MAATLGWTPDQLRKYDLNLRPIPKLDYADPLIDTLIAENAPVVITGTNLTASAKKWDLDYLAGHMGDGDYAVYFSKTHLFKYFDEGKLKNNPVEFKAPTKRADLKFKQFYSIVKNWKAGDDRLYLQQALNNTAGPSIVKDFLNFNWDWVNSMQTKHKWGPLTSNLLLVATEGNVTPCHYDEQQNMFSQVHGYKRFILFSPDQFDCLYPHPVSHPHDRQSQIDFDHPDYKKFPKFRDLKGMETVIGPGEVLFVPMYWWHHVESIMRGGYTVSVNFWYKSGPTTPITYPLKSHQKVAIMRNVEKMLAEALQNPAEVGPLLRALVLGRYTD